MIRPVLQRVSEGLQAFSIFNTSSLPAPLPANLKPAEGPQSAESQPSGPRHSEMAENFVDHEILRRIGQKLNIRVPVKSEADLARIVEKRLPLGAVTTLVEHGLKENEIYSLVLPRRTLQHRRAKKERLSREESDRAVRLARLVSLAEKIFGDPEAGMGWLRTTKKHFGDRTPIEMMATEIGSRLVEELLYQIDEGMAA